MTNSADQLTHKGSCWPQKPTFVFHLELWIAVQTNQFPGLFLLGQMFVLSTQPSSHRTRPNMENKDSLLHQTYKCWPELPAASTFSSPGSL